MTLSFRYLFAALTTAWLVPAQAASDSTPDPTFAATATDSPIGWRRSYQAGGGTQDERVVAARRAPDGGYVLAGKIAGGGAGSKIFLHKVRSDGSNDPSFGTSGRIVKDAFLSTVADMTIDAQGRIIVIGSTPGALGQPDFGIVRFASNGADDPSFAGDGGTSIAFDLDAGHSRVADIPGGVATLPDGSIFVVGLTQDETSGTAITPIGLVKLKPDGSRDTTYSNTGNGTSVYCRAQCSNVVSIARLVYDAPRNRLVIGGDFVQATNNTDWFLITQGLGSGEPSQTFAYAIDRGTAGGYPLDYMRGVAVQADGKILASGYTTLQTLEVRGVILRRDAGGVGEDTTFGNTSGRGLYVSPNDATIYNDVAVDGLGRIIVAGENAATRRGLVRRLTAFGGTPDSSFNAGAEALFAANQSNATTPSYSTMFRRVFMDGGKPVLAGESPDSSTANTDYDMVLMRLDSDLIFANGFQ